MKKLVIIGANEFQLPLIEKAKEMGYKTHVFAWKEGAVGAKYADYFYPISITRVDKILKECRRIQPDGVVTIGSDLANITVAKLADALKLPGNTLSCIEKSTNKKSMRAALKAAGIWTPEFYSIKDVSELAEKELIYPLIVKPTDRSGSRAITRVESEEELKEAIERAIDQSFEHQAIVESYISGQEYSMETISNQGVHYCLAITKKFTTGAPHYIERGHLQPAPMCEKLKEKCIQTISKALDALEIKTGASHAEFRINEQGEVRIIEIGSRMGGDCIGSHLVPLSFGYDFVKMVIQCAVGDSLEVGEALWNKSSSIKFIFQDQDRKQLKKIQKEHPGVVKFVQEPDCIGQHKITDSGSRYGFYIMQTDTMKEMEEILHTRDFEKEIPVCETPIQEIYGWEELGNKVYIKREDLLPFSFGGNKVRFARAFFEDMQKKHCDSMIIYGNYHSNLCRILSVACKREQIPCYMIYNTEDIEEKEDGNSRLIRDMGVIPVSCEKKSIAQAVAFAMRSLKEQGREPYYIYGNEKGEGNETIPMEAYVQVYEEICRQQKEKGIKFDYIFLASSTNTTQSGIVAGRLCQSEGPKIVGISVNRAEWRGRQVLENNLRIYANEKKIVFPENWRQEIYFSDQWLLGGYGSYENKIQEIIKKMYEENGIALDPIYTGKGFYGMIEYIKCNQIKNKNILFLHTGGTPLFFDYLTEEKKIYE